ncbi:hypothetical protein WJX74_004644 [Apatococcus lobatus]|uniref:Uncharacterized protein n=1 Tax=Apatococcus lobatus TaxID=904363 RepID=A0AAW1QJB2_9CHLO
MRDRLCSLHTKCIPSGGRSELALTVALCFHTSSLVVAAVPLAIGIPAFLVPPHSHSCLILLAVGITSFIAQLFLGRSYQLGSAGRISAIDYTLVVYVHVAGVMLLHEKDKKETWYGLTGTALIACGAVSANPSKPKPKPSSSGLDSAQGSITSVSRSISDEEEHAGLTQQLELLKDFSRQLGQKVIERDGQLSDLSQKLEDERENVSMLHQRLYTIEDQHNSTVAQLMQQVRGEQTSLEDCMHLLAMKEQSITQLRQRLEDSEAMVNRLMPGRSGAATSIPSSPAEQSSVASDTEGPETRLGSIPKPLPAEAADVSRSEELARQAQIEQQLRIEMQAQLMNQVKQNEKLSSQVAELAASAKASEEVVKSARSTAERAYQKDAQIARLEAALQESQEKLHKYQAAAGELKGQCQDQAAEITDLQQQLDGLEVRQGSTGTDWHSAMSRYDSLMSQLETASTASSQPTHDAANADLDDLSPSPSRRKREAPAAIKAKCEQLEVERDCLRREADELRDLLRTARLAQESAEETAGMLKQEIASLEESLSSLEPAFTYSAGLPSAASGAGSSNAASPEAALDHSSTTCLSAPVEGAHGGVSAASTSNRQHVQIPRRISVGFTQEAAQDGTSEQSSPTAQAASSELAVRPEDLVRQLTQLMNQNTELMTQLDEANSSLASSQEICNDLEVQLEETREETQASFQDQMRALQAQLSRVGDELAVTQQQAQELQESDSQGQEELRVARISSDHLSNDLARALEQASTWREECVALQTQVSQFALEFVKTRELEDRLETAESNLAVLAKAHTAAQDQWLALSSQASLPHQARLSWASSLPAAPLHASRGDDNEGFEDIAPRAPGIPGPRVEGAPTATVTLTLPPDEAIATGLDKTELEQQQQQLQAQTAAMCDDNAEQDASLACDPTASTPDGSTDPGRWQRSMGQAKPDPSPFIAQAPFAPGLLKAWQAENIQQAAMRRVWPAQLEAEATDQCQACHSQAIVRSDLSTLSNGWHELAVRLQTATALVQEASEGRQQQAAQAQQLAEQQQSAISQRLQETQEQCQSLQDQLTEALESLATLQDDLGSLRTARTSLNEALADKDMQIANLMQEAQQAHQEHESQLHSVQNRLQAQDYELKGNEVRIATLEMHGRETEATLASISMERERTQQVHQSAMHLTELNAQVADSAEVLHTEQQQSANACYELQQRLDASELHAAASKTRISQLEAHLAETTKQDHQLQANQHELPHQAATEDSTTSQHLSAQEAAIAVDTRQRVILAGAVREEDLALEIKELQQALSSSQTESACLSASLINMQVEMQTAAANHKKALESAAADAAHWNQQLQGQLEQASQEAINTQSSLSQEQRKVTEQMQQCQEAAISAAAAELQMNIKEREAVAQIDALVLQLAEAERESEDVESELRKELQQASSSLKRLQLELDEAEAKAANTVTAFLQDKRGCPSLHAQVQRDDSPASSTDSTSGGSSASQQHESCTALEYLKLQPVQAQQMTAAAHATVLNLQEEAAEAKAKALDVHAALDSQVQVTYQLKVALAEAEARLGTAQKQHMDEHAENLRQLQQTHTELCETQERAAAAQATHGKQLEALTQHLNTAKSELNSNKNEAAMQLEQMKHDMLEAHRKASGYQQDLKDQITDANKRMMKQGNDLQNALGECAATEAALQQEAKQAATLAIQLEESVQNAQQADALSKQGKQEIAALTGKLEDALLRANQTDALLIVQKQEAEVAMHEMKMQLKAALQRATDMQLKADSQAQQQSQLQDALRKVAEAESLLSKQQQIARIEAEQHKLQLQQAQQRVSEAEHAASFHQVSTDSTKSLVAAQTEDLERSARQAQQAAEMQRHIWREEMLQEELIRRTKEATFASDRLQRAQTVHQDQAAALQAAHAKELQRHQWHSEMLQGELKQSTADAQAISSQLQGALATQADAQAAHERDMQRQQQHAQKLREELSHSIADAEAVRKQLADTITLQSHAQDTHRQESQQLNLTLKHLQTRLDEHVITTKAASIRSAELQGVADEKEGKLRARDAEIKALQEKLQTTQKQAQVQLVRAASSATLASKRLSVLQQAQLWETSQRQAQLIPQSAEQKLAKQPEAACIAGSSPAHQLECLSGAARAVESPGLFNAASLGMDEQAWSHIEQQLGSLEATLNASTHVPCSMCVEDGPRLLSVSTSAELGAQTKQLPLAVSPGKNRHEEESTASAMSLPGGGSLLQASAANSNLKTGQMEQQRADAEISLPPEAGQHHVGSCTDDGRHVEEALAPSVVSNLKLLKRGQAVRLSNRITSRRSVSFQDEVDFAQQQVNGESEGQISAEAGMSSTQNPNKMEQALQAARAAADVAATENAAAQAEIGRLALRSAALEEKASQLDEQLKDRTAELQAALQQLGQARKKPQASGSSKAKPRWNSNTSRSHEVPEPPVPDRDFSRIAPIISQLQASLQQRSEAVTDLQEQLEKMETQLQESRSALQKSTQECKGLVEALAAQDGRNQAKEQQLTDLEQQLALKSQECLEAQAALIRLRAANQQLQLELDSVRHAAGSPAGLGPAKSPASPLGMSQGGRQGTSRPSSAAARSADEPAADRRIRELEAAARQSKQLILELQAQLTEAEYANPLFSGTRSLPSPPASSTADSPSVVYASGLRHRQHSQPPQWSPRTADLQRQASTSTTKACELSTSGSLAGLAKTQSGTKLDRLSSQLSALQDQLLQAESELNEASAGSPRSSLIFQDPHTAMSKANDDSSGLQHTGSRSLGNVHAARQLWMAKDKDILLLKSELNQAKHQLASAQEAFHHVQQSLSSEANANMHRPSK